MKFIQLVFDKIIRVCTIRPEQPRQAKIVLTVFSSVGTLVFDWKVLIGPFARAENLFKHCSTAVATTDSNTLPSAHSHTHLHTRTYTHTHTRTHTHAFTHTPSPSSSCTLLSAWISKRAEKLSSFSFQHEI